MEIQHEIINKEPVIKITIEFNSKQEIYNLITCLNQGKTDLVINNNYRYNEAAICGHILKEHLEKIIRN